MHVADVKKLKTGLYCLYWKESHGGGFSLAAVGMTHTQHWYACTNHTTEKENGDGIASTDWRAVEAAELLVERQGNKFRVAVLGSSSRRGMCDSWEVVK